MRTDGTANLDHYLKPILDHDKLIVVVTAVTTMLAVVAAFVLPDRYESTASVLLTPISGNPLTPIESDTDVDMPTELLISTSKAVVGGVAEDLAGQSIGLDSDELEDNISAGSPRDSKVLDLTYEAATPELARTIADLFAANYLEYREQIAAENRAAAVEALDVRISLLKEELSKIEGRLSQVEAGSQPHVALSVERDSVNGELEAQQDALAALSTLSLSAGEILSPARLPLAGTGPGLFTLVTGGLVGGLVIGSVLAMLVSAVKASKAPRNRRASDRIEHNRRQDDRVAAGSRRSMDHQSESAVEKLARVTAGRDQDQDAAADEDDEPQAQEPEIEEPEPDETEDSAPQLEEPEPDDTEPNLDPALSNPSAELRPESTTTGPTNDPLAAHFGVGVPPPPRNKAKLAVKAAAKAHKLDPSKNHHDVVEPAPVATTDLRAEADVERLVADIACQVADRSLACLTVGQDHRTQSVAAGFALVDALEELGIDVLLIDAVLDEPVLSSVLEVPDVPGLSEVLVGQISMESAIRRLDDLQHIHALTTGEATASARTAISTSKLRDLLREAKRRFPMTVVIGGDFQDAAAISATEGELDGLVIAASARVGEAPEPLLAGKLSRLHAPAWIRVSVDGDVTSTANNATTTV